MRLEYVCETYHRLCVASTKAVYVWTGSRRWR